MVSTDAKELLKEKTLFDIYVASRRIPATKFNFWVTFMVVCVLVVDVLYSPLGAGETAQVIRKHADSALGVTLSTLGFLIAGFTIFATVTQPGLSLMMARKRHDASGLSYLKHNYFMLMRVFIYYLAFAFLCLLVILFGHSGGVIDTLLDYSPHAEHVKFAISKFAYIVFFAFYFYLIVQLKSFVFNVYHIVMTALTWEAYQQNQSADDSE